jgi:hypothetical protein
MESLFWDSEGVIHIDFLQHAATINAWHAGSLLCNTCTKWLGRRDLRNCQRWSS